MSRLVLVLSAVVLWSSAVALAARPGDPATDRVASPWAVAAWAR